MSGHNFVNGDINHLHRCHKVDSDLVSPLLANITLSTCSPRLDGDAVTWFEVGHRRPDLKEWSALVTTVRRLK